MGVVSVGFGSGRAGAFGGFFSVESRFGRPDPRLKPV
jgi:hypothetical protein